VSAAGSWGGVKTDADVTTTPVADRPDLPLRAPARAATAAKQVGVAIVTGVAVAVAVTVPSTVPTGYGVLVGWDVSVLVYVGWVWCASWNLDADRTAGAAVRQDPTRSVTDVALICAAVASLAAVGFTIADAAHQLGPAKALRIALSVATIVCGWFLVNTVFALKYARLYYLDSDGGITFNQPDPPTYSDFAYLAFTIGMTFQVSDTNLGTQLLRRLALRHMLLAYLFGAVILSVTINLLVSLSG
jgi:uncharacterized membrane protein